MSLLLPCSYDFHQVHTAVLLFQNAAVFFHMSE